MSAGAHSCELVVRVLSGDVDDYRPHVKQGRFDDEHEELVVHVVGETGLGYGLGAGRYMPIRSVAPWDAPYCEHHGSAGLATSCERK